MQKIAAFTALCLFAASACTRHETTAVSAVNVLAEAKALAGPDMRGRGSGTADEAKAAAWIAGEFKKFGLVPAPGATDFLQKAPLILKRVTGDPKLTVGGIEIPGIAVLRTNGGTVGGKAARLASLDGKIPEADVIVYAGTPDKLAKVRRALSKQTKLLVVAESDMSKRFVKSNAGKTMIRPRLKDQAEPTGPAVVAVPAAALAKIGAGTNVSLSVPVAVEDGVTTNVVGYLPGSDPKAGVILLTAHLDHLGVRPDGVVMPGANDDASGTVAVLELARAFGGERMKRGILFVAYGSEEAGALGSTWFGDHLPVPLTDIVANIEFEMIGAQDPKLPKGSLMMTGSERSNLFELMKSQGAMIAADPYPDEHFFERSDNYSLALKGIVAHTFSGWAVVPTYHEPTDTVENLNIPYMTAAIQSLIAPIRLLASSDQKPAWKANGQPRKTGGD